VKSPGLLGTGGNARGEHIESALTRISDLTTTNDSPIAGHAGFITDVQSSARHNRRGGLATGLLRLFSCRLGSFTPPPVIDSSQHTLVS
jgi:hypothetical protein